MEPKFEPLNCKENDVVVIGNSSSLVAKINDVFNLVRTDDLRQKIVDKIKEKNLVGSDFEGKNLCCEYGTDGQILRVGAPNWVKGKIRLTVQLEFAPDEPEVKEPIANNTQESPLDDLRRTIAQTN
jgi:hypothetical protein